MAAGVDPEEVLWEVKVMNRKALTERDICSKFISPGEAEQQAAARDQLMAILTEALLR